MKTVTIYLGSIDKVKSFVNDVTKFDCDFDLIYFTVLIREAYKGIVSSEVLIKCIASYLL